VVVRRRRKSRKLRGSRTMGWGSIGQHRKSGSRGGKGAVGMHKHRWTWVIKYFPDWFGKRGFTRVNPAHQPIVKGINVGELDELAYKLMIEGKAVMEGDKVVINVTKLGFNKVLGKGKVTRKLKVITPEITESAREKIVNAGGEVVLLGSKEG